MYHDLLVKIKNAERARKKTVRTIFSEMDFEIAKILVEEGYLKGAKKKAADKKSFLELELASRDREHALRGVKFLSVPSRRLYVGYRALKAVKQGYGLGILSTPKGILTNKDAKKQKVGGEYLFQIW